MITISFTSLFGKVKQILIWIPRTLGKFQRNLYGASIIPQKQFTLLLVFLNKMVEYYKKSIKIFLWGDEVWVQSKVRIYRGAKWRPYVLRVSDLLDLNRNFVKKVGKLYRHERCLEFTNFMFSHFSNVDTAAISDFFPFELISIIRALLIVIFRFLQIVSKSYFRKTEICKIRAAWKSKRFFFRIGDVILSVRNDTRLYRDNVYNRSSSGKLLSRTKKLRKNCNNSKIPIFLLE